MKKDNGFTLAEVFSPHYVGKCNPAFTLAEVLITLGIIGVVAAMTLPTLIQNYQEKVTINKLKKMYSVLSQAYTMHKIDNDENIFYTYTSDNAIKVAEIFKPHLKISKDCGVEDSGCLPSEGYKRWDRPSYTSTIYATNDKYYSIVLDDGSLLVFRGGDLLEFASAEIFYDINGKNPPNTWGKDMFSFSISIQSNKLIPIYADFYKQSCIIEEESVLWDCTSWVLINENMDYLHCPEKLSWDGKTSCK